MADGGFRFSGTGQYFYQPQNQQAHHPRLRNGSPVNNPRIGFHNNDTPSPNRSPGTHSPAYNNMYNHGHQQNQHSLLNGGSHQRFQMQMGMGKHFQHQGNQHQGGHHQTQHSEHGAPNGHAFANHQHNISTGTLSSATPHFTPSAHLQSSTPLGTHGGLNKPTSEHWAEQIRLAQISRESTQPHHYARTSPNVKQVVAAGLQPGGLRKDDEKEEKQRPSHGNNQAAKQIWQALDFGGQGLKAISPSLFRYPFLEKLYFNHNKLSWLTPQIGQLRCLTFLDLSQNHLDTVPAEIGMLINLKTLYLFDNNLETLPFEMGSLYQLDVLGIEGNPLSEDIKSIVAEAGTGELIRYLREQASVPAPPNERDWVVLDETPLDADEEDRFTTLSWNILCDKYVNHSQYPYVPTGALAWAHRRDLIVDEIRARAPDILCLQEIDAESFNEDFRPTLAVDDYKGLFFQKSRAQTMADKEAKLVDGCATFYKNSKYILLDKQVIQFGRSAINRPDMKGEHDIFNRVMTRDDIATVAFFENRATGSRLVVVNTHIYWDPAFADVKVIQIAILMEHLTRLTTDYAKWPPCKDKELFRYANGDEADGEAVKEPGPSMYYASGSDIPMVLCGDFNSVPGTGVYDLMAHGSIANTHADLAGRNYGNFTREGVHHPFTLKSTYSNIGELDFTNYVAHYNGVLDYIWYSPNSLQNMGLLGELDKEYLQRVPGFPNWHFPSDHLVLFAEYAVKAKKEKKVVEADFGPQRDRRT